MIEARVEHGRIEVREPIPLEWEGQLVKVTPMTPDDPLPDLEERMATLHALGAMEFDSDEQHAIVRVLDELDQASLIEMRAIASVKP